MDKKITATIQARMGSKRLPGKVLKQIINRPVLELQIERVKRSKLVQEVIIATADSPENDPIEELGKKIGVRVFRGSENDVMSRISGAINKFNIGIHVELHGDCPFSDPVIIDEFVMFFLNNQFDYISNDMETSYPPGLEVAVYDALKFLEAEKMAKGPDIREHASLFIKMHPEIFRIKNILAPEKINYPDMYIELDTEDDFCVVEKIYEALYKNNPAFSAYDIVEFLKKNSELLKINKDTHRRWKKYRFKEVK